jgi:N-acyl amino acid synthase of PEP-CTERM/exosortase system
LDRSLKKTTSPIRNGQCPVARFNTYFQAVSADTRELIDKAFALRYQVYCLEREFEDPGLQAGKLETDQFDRHSVHSLVFHRPQEEPIGTARLILPQARPYSLPIQDLLRKTGLNACDYFPNHSVAEISRFAISKEFRRRKVETGALAEAEAKRERHGNLPCLGLVQMVLRQSIELGIEYWGAVMEPQLLRMLALMGIRFQPIGPLVSYHGLRQPSFCHIPVMMRNMALTKPESWAIVTNNGELMPARMEFEAPLRRVA